MNGALSRSNSFDLLRLGFALLVVFCHCWGMLGRVDPISGFLHVGSGAIAVCGFFVLSGYLISKSWRRDPGIAFFRNRLLRIAPGFAVAFLISVAFVGAVGSADARAYWAALNWPDQLMQLVSLHGPVRTPPAFVGQPQPVLNGPLWTIKYEFLCYLLTPIFLWRRGVMYGAWVVAIGTAIALPDGPVGIICAPRFVAMFLSGAILADLNMPNRRWLVVAAALVLAALLPFGRTWELGLATGGAYLVIAAGRRPSPLTGPDVSYGTYLYGWPIQNLLIFSGVVSPWVLVMIALPLALLLGLASWVFIERPSLALKVKPDPQRMVLAG